MPAIKKLVLGLLSSLFVILLFSTAFDIGFVRIATHPATVKRLVSESGVYDSVVPNLLSQAKSISTNYGTVSTTAPAVEKAAASALSPAFIRQNAEMGIDNIYDWLDGKIAEPNFKIDLTGSKTLFANQVADQAVSHLKTLPPCSVAQSRQIAQTGQYDAFNATCLPRGLSIDMIAAQIKQGITGSQDFLKDANVSADSVKNSQGQSVFSGQLASAPKQYQRAKKTPVILSILTILAGVGIVFLSRSWQIGLRHVGITLLAVGLLMLAFSWALNRTMSKNIIPKIKVDNAIFQQDIRALAADVTHQIGGNYYFFGGLYAGLGAISVAAAEISRRRAQPNVILGTKSAPANGGASQAHTGKKA
jgi:hypothetical protein